MGYVLELIHTACSWVVVGLTLVLFAIWLLSALTIFVWLRAGFALIFAGVNILWFAAACAYIWACAVWYVPYLEWFEAFKNAHWGALGAP
jgi:hypothetical protein